MLVAYLAQQQLTRDDSTSEEWVERVIHVGLISDARKSLGYAQDSIRTRKHKKTLKKVRQELNQILDS